MHRRSLLHLPAVVLAVALTATLAACGGTNAHGTAAKNIQQLPKDFITGNYLGLTPVRENIKSSLSNQDANAYITSVGLFSLRKGDQLEATLQVAKLAKDARPQDLKFQEQVANQIGGTKVQAFVMGGHAVYRSSQRKQSLTSWFDGHFFLILAVRDTYQTPRELLRTLLDEVHPK